MRLDDALLLELGYGPMPAADRARLLTEVQEAVALRVGRRMTEGLDDAALDDWERVTEGDVRGAEVWLDAHDPFWRDRLPAAPAPSVVQELAAARWLDLVVPGYRTIAEEEVLAAREHLAAYRDRLVDPSG